jgi:uncharacterized protein YcbK (DUF882 family)
MKLWHDDLTRRKLIEFGLIATAVASTRASARAAEWVTGHSLDVFPAGGQAGDKATTRHNSALARSLSFYNVHTGERLNTVYFENGSYVPAALGEVNHFFRDFRVNQVKPIDPRLLDLLYQIHLALATSQPFNLISGYRSPATNAWLASRSKGVSRHSLHMQGKASDINVQGRPLALLQNVARTIRGGGVGYYPDSDFVHVDIGRVRRW